MILETQRLVLRPIFESECSTLQRIFADPHVRKYLCDDEVFSLEQVGEMLKQSVKHFEEEKFGLWFIQVKGENEAIGFVGLWYFFEEEQPQLIYALLPEALKQGYALKPQLELLSIPLISLVILIFWQAAIAPTLSHRK
jgi:[ribosomal protein S5]-alanine N-acetyltransferase